jgi:hypothetical protein
LALIKCDQVPATTSLSFSAFASVLTALLGVARKLVILQVMVCPEAASEANASANKAMKIALLRYGILISLGWKYEMIGKRE